MMKRYCQQQMCRWLAVLVVLLVSAIGCADDPAGVSCSNGGVARSDSGIRYCEYDAVQLGVQESGFLCPPDLPFIHKSTLKWFCFQSETDLLRWLGNLGDVIEPDQQLDVVDSDTAVTGCQGTPPSCYTCSSDVEQPASCVGNNWSCPAPLKLGHRSDCTFEMYPACESVSVVCCNSDGTSYEPRCPSPSQPTCKQGVAPTASCEALTVHFTNVNASYTAGATISPSLENGSQEDIFWGDCTGFYKLERYDSASQSWTTYKSLPCSALVDQVRTLGSGQGTSVIKPMLLADTDGSTEGAVFRLHGRYWTQCPNLSGVFSGGSECSAGPFDVYSDAFRITPISLPSKQTVTFQFSTSTEQSFFVVQTGYGCDRMQVDGYKLGIGFQCPCECPAPTAPFADVLGRVNKTLGTEIIWDARVLTTYQTTVDCAARGWPEAGTTTTTTGYFTPLPAGTYTVRFAVYTTLPSDCADTGQPSVFCTPTSSATFPDGSYGICDAPGTPTEVSVDVVLPQSGDLVVPVVLE